MVCKGFVTGTRQKVISMGFVTLMVKKDAMSVTYL